MKISQIKRIINGLGQSTDTTIQVPEIRSLIFSTNQGIHHHEEFLYIDSTDNLINIKKYNFRVISGRLSNLITVADKFISSKSTLYLRHNYYPFRAPKIGDTIMVIDKNGKILDGSKTVIDKISSNFIEIRNAFPKFNKDEHIVVYADTELLESSVQDKKTPALFFVYTPKTENEFDVYLDGETLIGIEMYSALAGNL